MSGMAQSPSASRLLVAAWPGPGEPGDANPYTRLLYGAMASVDVEVTSFLDISRGRPRPDIVHVHWPEFALHAPTARHAAVRAATVLRRLRVARRSGARLVWTVHNVSPHRNLHRRLSDRYWGMFVPMVDGFISMTDSGAERARQHFPDLVRVPSAVIPHGHYRDAYPAAVDR